MPVAGSVADHGNNQPVEIRGVTVGDGSCYVIAEIGINHDGNFDIARHMIDVAARAGANAVKFQKRTLDVVYSQAEMQAPRTSWFGKSNGDLKRGLEFSTSQYVRLGDYAHEAGLAWGASCWDEFSVGDVCAAKPDFLKVASPSITNENILATVASYKRDLELPVILSTGMSTLDEVTAAFKRLGHRRLILMHCVSAYPAPVADLNLSMIRTLKEKYQVPVGYSGHEQHPQVAVWAAAIGADCIERHFTLDRRMWGSDQALSINGEELADLVETLAVLKQACGGVKDAVLPCEMPAMKKLRRA